MKLRSKKAYRINILIFVLNLLGFFIISVLGVWEIFSDEFIGKLLCTNFLLVLPVFFLLPFTDPDNK